MADDTINPYFAGFFDGEGSVAIYRKKYVVSLTNTDVRPLLVARERWGGFISCQSKEGRPCALRDIHRWQIYGQKSRAFLEAIRPFVLLKGDQIDAYLAILGLIPSGRGQRRQIGVSAIVDLASARLKALKRGVAGTFTDDKYVQVTLRGDL